MEWIVWIGVLLVMGALKFAWYYARVRWSMRKWN